MVFLGNPGKTYEKTRHNAGFLVCDTLFPAVSWQKKFHALYAQDGAAKLLKPQTYMNVSGLSVGEAASFFHFEAQEIMVVHDDVELPFGTVRLQLGGGLQGHNGLKSIRDALTSDQFLRIRIGIGRPRHGDVASFVLSAFTSDELIGLSVLFPKIKTLFANQEQLPKEILLD